MSLAIENGTVALPETEVEAGIGARVNRFVRILPSLTDLSVIFTLVFLFTRMGGTQSMLGDGDTGWHIRTGQWILTNHQVPYRDMFSYTMPGAPWFAWEWLWDAVFAAIYNCSGLGGVVMVSLVVLCVTMAMLFRLVRRKCGNVLVAFAVTTIAIAGSSMHWFARPHMVTLLFGVIFFSILERVKDALESGNTVRARRLLWLLPPMTVVWANLHAGFVLGVILTGCYAAGEGMRWLLLPAEDQPGTWRRGLHYAAASCGCLLASLVNPYFTALHTHMIEFLHNSYAYDHIGEYQSVSFHSSMAWTWEAMLVLGAISVFRELLRRRFIYALIVIVWMHLGLMAGRNIPIFMLLAAPIIAWNIAELLSSIAHAPVAGWLRRASAAFDHTAAEIDETDRLPRIHLASLAALVVVGALIYAPAPPEKFRAEYNPKRYPAKALAFMGAPGIPNRIFTDDEWGDYLLYRMYPTKVFVDGRADMYGEKFNLNYLDISAVKYDWEQSLAQYRVDTILLPTAAPLAGALKESRNWRVVYDDHIAIVFRPVASAAPPGERVSALPSESGTGRDRKVTKSEGRDRTITKTTT